MYLFSFNNNTLKQTVITINVNIVGKLLK